MSSSVTGSAYGGRRSVWRANILAGPTRPGLPRGGQRRRILRVGQATCAGRHEIKVGVLAQGKDGATVGRDNRRASGNGGWGCAGRPRRDRLARAARATAGRRGGLTTTWTAVDGQPPAGAFGARNATWSSGHHRASETSASPQGGSWLGGDTLGSRRADSSRNLPSGRVG